MYKHLPTTIQDHYTDEQLTELTQAQQHYRAIEQKSEKTELDLLVLSCYRAYFKNIFGAIV